MRVLGASTTNMVASRGKVVPTSLLLHPKLNLKLIRKCFTKIVRLHHCNWPKG